MKVIYWHNKETPNQHLIAVETIHGYFECSIPYEDEDLGYVPTMIHSISVAAFDQSVKNGSWVIESIVTN